MRLAHVAALVRMFFIYFFRRVLSYGPLKHPGALLGLIALAVSTGVAMFLAAYQFLEDVLQPDSLELVARLSSVSTIFWTLVIFLFIKILFMKSDKLLQFTLQLPTGHRERTAALMVYEAAMVLSAIMVLFLPLTSAVLGLLGWSSLPYLAGGIVIPAVMAYLIASFVYNLTMMSMLRVGLGRHAHLFTAVLVALAIFAYNSNFPTLVQQISRDYFKSAVSNHYVDVFTYIFARWGQGVMWLAFVVSALVLLSLVVLSSPHRYPEVHKFTNTSIPWRHLAVWPYLAALVRRWENWVTVGVAYASTAMLFFRGDEESFLYGMGLLVTQGIYAYSATDSLRRLPGYHRRAEAEVGLLLSAQFVQFVVAAVPILLLLAVRPDQVGFAGKVILACGSAIILTTLVGIVFPHDRDNPFSAFVSYAVCVLMITAVGMMVSVLQLPAPVLWVAVLLVHALAILYSVIGVRVLQRKARHASVVVRTA